LLAPLFALSNANYHGRVKPDALFEICFLPRLSADLVLIDVGASSVEIQLLWRNRHSQPSLIGVTLPPG